MDRAEAGGNTLQPALQTGALDLPCAHADGGRTPHGQGRQRFPLRFCAQHLEDVAGPSFFHEHGDEGHIQRPFGQQLLQQWRKELWVHVIHIQLELPAAGGGSGLCLGGKTRVGALRPVLSGVWSRAAERCIAMCSSLAHQCAEHVGSAASASLSQSISYGAKVHVRILTRLAYQGLEDGGTGGGDQLATSA